MTVQFAGFRTSRQVVPAYLSSEPYRPHFNQPGKCRVWELGRARLKYNR